MLFPSHSHWCQWHLLRTWVIRRERAESLRKRGVRKGRKLTGVGWVDSTQLSRWGSVLCSHASSAVRLSQSPVSFLPHTCPVAGFMRFIQISQRHYGLKNKFIQGLLGLTFKIFCFVKLIETYLRLKKASEVSYISTPLHSLACNRESNLRKYFS